MYILIFHFAKILYPLTLYEESLTTVQKKISGYLRRCIDLPRSLSSTDLYEVSNALEILFRKVVEDFKVTRRGEILYRDSKAPKV